jgi:hypothetical protein
MSLVFYSKMKVKINNYHVLHMINQFCGMFSHRCIPVGISTVCPISVCLFKGIYFGHIDRMPLVNRSWMCPKILQYRSRYQMMHFVQHAAFSWFLRFWANSENSNSLAVAHYPMDMFHVDIEIVFHVGLCIFRYFSWYMWSSYFVCHNSCKV